MTRLETYLFNKFNKTNQRMVAAMRDGNLNKAVHHRVEANVLFEVYRDIYLQEKPKPTVKAVRENVH